ncbi:MAG TPA: helix-turn-helix domain-containing protein [Actinotalea sp.]|nr:helix-turn-helix domain-containing protein [Actinotalea sp.]
MWNQPYGGADKTVDVHLHWLRRKLGESADAPRYLHRVRGVGSRSPRRHEAPPGPVRACDDLGGPCRLPRAAGPSRALACVRPGGRRGTAGRADRGGLRGRCR